MRAKAVVVGVVELGQLDVEGLVGDVPEAHVLRLLLGEDDEALGDVDAVRMAIGPDQLRDLLRRLAEAAADVERPPARRWGVGLERPVAEPGEAADQDLPVPDPDVEERPVPGVGRFDVVLEGPDLFGGHQAPSLWPTLASRRGGPRGLPPAPRRSGRWPRSRRPSRRGPG